MPEIVWTTVVNGSLFRSADKVVDLRAIGDHFVATRRWPSGGRSGLRIETADVDEAKVQAAAWAQVATEEVASSEVAPDVAMPPLPTGTDA